MAIYRPLPHIKPFKINKLEDKFAFAISNRKTKTSLSFPKLEDDFRVTHLRRIVPKQK